MIIVIEDVCIFIDCIYIEKVTDHTSSIYWDRVKSAPERMYIFLSSSVTETATGRMVLHLY